MPQRKALWRSASFCWDSPVFFVFPDQFFFLFLAMAVTSLSQLLNLTFWLVLLWHSLYVWCYLYEMHSWCNHKSSKRLVAVGQLPSLLQKVVSGQPNGDTLYCDTLFKSVWFTQQTIVTCIIDLVFQACKCQQNKSAKNHITAHREKVFNSKLGRSGERGAAIYVDNVCLGRSLEQAE